VFFRAAPIRPVGAAQRLAGYRVQWGKPIPITVERATGRQALYEREFAAREKVAGNGAQPGRIAHVRPRERRAKRSASTGSRGDPDGSEPPLAEAAAGWRGLP